MPRNISFMLTTDQVRARTKTETRRLGWLFLKRGTILRAVEQSQGLKKGERVRSLGLIRVRKAERVRLDRITPAQVKAEGFPELSPSEFVRFFCRSHKGCTSETAVTRIVFEYI